MNTQLEVVRDQRLEPIQGRVLMRSNVIPLNQKKRSFKPSTVVFMFMSIGGTIAFIIGYLSI